MSHSLPPQLADLAGELAHHINNPLALVNANLVTLERLCQELRSSAGRGGSAKELDEVLADIKTGLKQIGEVVHHMTHLSFQLKTNEHLITSPFSRTPSKTDSAAD